MPTAARLSAGLVVSPLAGVAAGASASASAAAAAARRSFQPPKIYHVTWKPELGLPFLTKASIRDSVGQFDEITLPKEPPSAAGAVALSAEDTAWTDLISEGTATGVVFYVARDISGEPPGTEASPLDICPAFSNIPADRFLDDADKALVSGYLPAPDEAMVTAKAKANVGVLAHARTVAVRSGG